MYGNIFEKKIFTKNKMSIDVKIINRLTRARGLMQKKKKLTQMTTLLGK